MQTKLLTKGVPYTFRRNGYYYFTRRVPTDLQHLYQSPRIVIGLRTKSETVAWRRAVLEAAKLETSWEHLRSARSIAQTISKTTGLVFSQQPEKQLVTVAHDSMPTLASALNIYISVKGEMRGALFASSAKRACDYLALACGEKTLDEYTRQDALRLRTALIERGLSGSSIVRIVGSIRAIFRFVSSELGLELQCPFERLFVADASISRPRIPIDVRDIRLIQSLCRQQSDDIRLLVSLVSDTGMRLAEACGLALDDLVLDDDPVPHIKIRSHSWRGIKNAGSARYVPLIGEAFWSACEIKRSPKHRWFAFPRYNVSGLTNANAASAATNKWLKQVVSRDVSMHGFRHALRDRLRAVECPSDVVDAIGGWATPGVGSAYGRGYPLTVLHSWLQKIAL